MFPNIKSIQSCLFIKALQVQTFLQDRTSERGEESASVAAITGLVLLIILIIMGIFRNALVAAFERIAAMLAF